MLDDFLKSNDSSAEITKHVQKQSLAKCTLFISGNISLISITHFKETPLIEKLKEIFGFKNLKHADNEKTEQITGYKKDSLPPISVYGAKIIIDEKLMNKEFLFFEIADRKFLKITPNDIILLNECAAQGNITD